jgi:tyrosine-protein kinase Etk/Wzc
MPDMKVVFNGVEKGKYGYGYNYGNEYYQAISKSKKSRVKTALRSFFKRF